MGGFSLWHWLIVGLVILLLFGKGRFSDMMGDVAKGIKSFKKGMSEDEEAEQRRLDRRARRQAQPTCRRRSRRAGRAGAAPTDAPTPTGRPEPASSRRKAPMFGIDSGELLIIAVVALVVIGPKDLPRVMRTDRPVGRQGARHGRAISAPASTR